MDLKGCRAIQINNIQRIKKLYIQRSRILCKEVRDIEKKVNLIYSEIMSLNL